MGKSKKRMVNITEADCVPSRPTDFISGFLYLHPEQPDQEQNTRQSCDSSNRKVKYGQRKRKPPLFSEHMQEQKPRNAAACPEQESEKTVLFSAHVFTQHINRRTDAVYGWEMPRLCQKLQDCPHHSVHHPSQ